VITPLGGNPSPDWSDQRLVDACLRSDSEAWCALIGKYKRLIYSIPIKFGLSREDASEVFQQVCLRMLSQLGGLRNPTCLPAWLMKVTSSQCLELSRQQARYAAINDEVIGKIAETRTTETVLRECEKEQIVREAIHGVQPRCKELIHLLFFESPPPSYEETARRLNVAAGSIGFIRMRCLKKLRRSLEEKGF